MEEPGFWDNADKAQGFMKELKNLKDTIEEFKHLKVRFEDVQTLIQMGYEENDESLLPEIEEAMELFIQDLEELKLRTLLSGEYDKYNAILTLHAGAGGTESCDWASMLCRMYQRWADKKGFTTEMIDFLDGEEAGLKSVTLQINGENAYGYRNFIMEKDNKEVLAVANSIWVYVDTETGRPTKIPKDYPITSGYGMSPAYPMDKVERKVELPDNFDIYPSFKVNKSNIDSYNHVNNGQYIKLAEEYLPDNFIVNTMRVEYRAQAVLGNSIVPMIFHQDEIMIVVLADENQKPYAIIEFRGTYS